MKKPTPFGKYYLLERINVGGMAEVFRAKAFGVEGFERLVAVKRILPNIAEDKEFIRMFIEEAKLAVQLNHANIAQIFDLGVVDGSYYIALEHIHGRDLRGMFDRCRQLGEPMPVAQACFTVMKVCEGLDYAHNKRDQAGRELHLVHRDVSPQNILVSFEGEVKLIDFGIAKAAGKGSKTQAGILKGKFGYMSPEQVRGIPIDRRSDVFSCGIVLYELLTGERLFVGESDFSTLEKVRNVEILPPSTYNRRIPDELERIVLKALAKDPEERYQNAIDLHDELQAFVYTAGEFYSRKDLAGWMKKTFGREIEEETAKLESYRQLKPPTPVEPSPAVARAPTPSRQQTGPATAPLRKSQLTGAVPSGTKPPPPPPTPRLSQQMQAVGTSPPPPRSQPPAMKARGGNEDGLSWDDDELETQIYDDDDPRKKSGPGVAHASTAPISPVSPAVATGSPPKPAPPPPAPPPPPSIPPVGPDLSSLVSTGKGWGDAGASSNGLNGANGANGASHLPSKPPGASTSFSAVSSQVGARSSGAMRAATPTPTQELSDLVPLADNPALTDPMSSFGQGILRREPRPNRTYLYLAIAAALAVVATVVVVVAARSRSTPSAAPPSTAVADPNTGFDLYVSPAGVTTWRLDGQTRTDRLPSRIRGIAPGRHTVAIEAPPGFMSQDQPVDVEKGKAPKIEIVLSPVQGITGDFESTPPGAQVSLIVDGKRTLLGASPASAPLDPRRQYQVLFELQGYVSINRPIVISGAMQEKVAVTLEKAAPTAGTPTPAVPDTHAVTEPAHTVTEPVHTVAAVTPPSNPVVHPQHSHPSVTPTPPSGGTVTPPDTGTSPAPAGFGTLLLGSKPPCTVTIDGKLQDAHTPHKFDHLSAGKHRITLDDATYNIHESFTVEIKADATTKEIKDYSDKLPKE